MQARAQEDLALYKHHRWCFWLSINPAEGHEGWKERAGEQTPTYCVPVQWFIHSTSLGKLTSDSLFWGAWFLLRPIYLSPLHTPWPSSSSPPLALSSTGVVRRIPAPDLQVEELQSSQGAVLCPEMFTYSREGAEHPLRGRSPTFSRLPGTPTHPPSTRHPPSRCPLARGVGAGVHGGDGDREQAVYRETIQPCPQSRLASAHRSPRDA